MNSNNNIYLADENNFLGNKINNSENTLDDLLSSIEYFFTIKSIDNYEEKKELLEGVKGAFFLAQRAHYGQYRDSGEEYIQHPLRVAIKIVTEYGNLLPKKLFFEAIKIALLHDVKEDGGINEKTLDNNFGKIVEKSVSLLTKEPWQNFIEDKSFIKKDTIRAKQIGKKLRDQKYFHQLTLLKEKKYNELNMLDFSNQEQEDIRTIVFCVKGFDRLDNHKSHGTQSSNKIGNKVLETNNKIIPLLSEEHPKIVSKLNEQIKLLVKNRLNGNQPINSKSSMSLNLIGN